MIHSLNLEKRLPTAFFESENGKEPVREWILSLSQEGRKQVGRRVRVLEFGWPIGMPVCRSITNRSGLWEVRISFASRRIARVLFCIHGGRMVLLHGFIKKTEKTPKADLDLATKRMEELQ